MIYPDKPFYVIDGFSCRSDLDMSAYDFSIGLNADFAMKAYCKEITELAFNKLDKIAKKMLKTIKLDSSFIYPYKFLENEKGKPTLLLQWCNVPGDACDLGIDGFKLDFIKKGKLSQNEMVIYNPHNIDSMKQAYALLSIWLNWSNFAYANID